MKHSFIISILTLATLLTGCESMGPDAQQGAVYGGLGGAALGGIIGHQSGRGLEGAAIGAGLGALAGGVIGDAQDQKRAEQIAYQRQMEAERAEADRARADAERVRLMSYGYSVDAPEVLAARRRAEAAEAQVRQLRSEQAAALQRAREIEEYRAREAAARDEYNRLQTGRAY